MPYPAEDRARYVERRERDLLVLMGPGVFKYAVLIQVAVSMLRRYRSFCDEIAFRCGAEFGMQRAGDNRPRA